MSNSDGFFLSIDTDDLIEALRDIGAVPVKVGGPLLYQEGELVMTQAKVLTPVDTGALRASGHVKKPVSESGAIIVQLGFGGAAMDYAVPVHERLDVYHPVGQAKFLEEPVYRWAEDGPRRLGAAIGAALAKAAK